MIINPYKSVNFETSLIVPSFTHGHFDGVYCLQRYVNAGFKHWPISNYHPSNPTHDLSAWGVEMPSDCILSSNSEHHGAIIKGVVVQNFHFCSVGSEYSSGSPSGQYPNGVNTTWQNAFNDILDNLLYPDGGGITLNHPSWSRCNGTNVDTEFLIEKLRYDDRVLGCEVLNGGGMRNNNGYDETTWDDILKTGTRCWGFFTPDWGITKSMYRGYNMLLVPEFTDHSCMRAYRNGEFYGMDTFGSPRFTSISFDENTYIYHVSCDDSLYIDVVIDGVRTRYEGNDVEVQVPKNAVYCRAVAKNDDLNIEESETKQSWTQPVMLKQMKKKIVDELDMWW